MMWSEPEQTMTYKKWRETNNPWDGNFFIGYLNPDDATDANLIDGIHSTIDEVFGPRYIGVSDPDRFKILFFRKLSEIEFNFYESFRLDSHYDTLVDMLKTIDMNSNTNGTNESKSSGENVTSNDLTDTTNTTIGERNDENETTYDVKDARTSSLNGETKNVATGKNRVLHSDMPQSNVASSTGGLDTDVKWNFASDLNDTLNQGTDTNTTITSGTDENNRTGTTGMTSKLGEQSNVSSVTKTGKVTVENIGTNTGKTTSESTNNGRNVNVASIRQEWRSLLYSTITSIKYLLDNCEPLFISVWD